MIQPDLVNLMLLDNSFEGVGEVIPYAVYFHKSSVDVSIAIFAKSCFPFVLHCAAIGEVSEARPFKAPCFYRASSLIEVPARINHGHPQLFLGRVPINELHAIPLSGVSCNTFTQDRRPTCSPATS